MRRYCSSGEPLANGASRGCSRARTAGSGLGNAAGSESSLPAPVLGLSFNSGFHVLATIENAAAMYEPPETAAR